VSKGYYVSFEVLVFPTGEQRIWNGYAEAPDKKTAVAKAAIDMVARVPNYVLIKVVLAERVSYE
jgi:hypothetical protein